ncbi:MAG: M2 family metallopeptidase [Sedimentisphaerales bacterium]|nr:M2 family metallopeptidase [Sedimentisphaerales bacterium]
MKILVLILVLVSLVVNFLGCGGEPDSVAKNADEQKLQKFIVGHLAKIQPLQKQAALAEWDAAVSGNDADYKKSAQLRLQISQVYSNAQDFALLKELRESNQIKNHLLARQLDSLYRSYLRNQLDPDLLRQTIELATKIEQTFSTHRGQIDSREFSNNEILQILKTETDSNKRQQAWQASKQVGAAVADDLIKLAKLRNQAAQKVGFDNYHTLSLTLSEQKVEELDRIFNDLYEQTNEPFARLKAELDGILAGLYNVPVDQLMPWHYHDPFFQEAPQIFDSNLDAYYAGKDIEKLARDFYSGINLPVDSILANSDLYEKPGKNPHAFCIDIDRVGDVRVLCNLQGSERWMDTMLHELGHAVYDKYHDNQTPYLLREPAHAFTTEGIAMFFGRLSSNPAWMQQTLGLTVEQRMEIEKVSKKFAQLKQLIFIRWDMVMYNFEKQLYANPDQDLNSLWWDMVRKYQLIKKPANRDAPDWAAKIHFTIAPCYYHNYSLGEMFASQLHQYLVNNVLKLDSDQNVTYINQKKVGDYLHENVFAAGSVYNWDKMIAQATGERLNPKYFVKQFVD